MKCMTMPLAVIAAVVGTVGSSSRAEAVSPRQLVEIVDFSPPVLSPDGANVAFRTEQASVERNTYDTVWYVQSMQGSLPPRRVAEGGVLLRDNAGTSLPAAPVWSPDGNWIFYLALVDGKIDVWRAAANGSGAWPVTRDPADVREFSLSADGRELKYAIGATRDEVLAAEQAEYDLGIRVDETVPIGQGLFRSGYIEGRLATQRIWNSDGARVPLLAKVPNRWKTVDLTTGEAREVALPVEVPEPMTGPELTDGLQDVLKLAHDTSHGRLAVLTQVGDKTGLQDRPYVELTMVPAGGGARQIKCLAELCTNVPITGIQWRPKTDDVLFTVTDPDAGQAQSIFRWNVETGAVDLVVHTRGVIGGGGRYTSGECGLSKAALACVTAEANRPPRLERIGLETGDRRILFDPNAAVAQELSKALPPRLVNWTDERGRTISGWFFPARRAGAAPPPLFVNYYWCQGFVRGGVGDEWPMASHVERGIAALCITSPPTPLDAVERYDVGLSAVANAVKVLAAAGEIDGTRVGMGGLSLGSEVTLWTAMHSDLLMAASVSSPAITETFYLLESMAGDTFFNRMQKFWQIGAPDETPERWKLISLAPNSEKIRTPVLMQLPEQEYIHSLDYAIPLLRDGRADLYVYPHEPHIKFQPRHKLSVYQRNLDWFEFWLLGVEGEDSSKAAQYSRWRRMKERHPEP